MGSAGSGLGFVVGPIPSPVVLSCAVGRPPVEWRAVVRVRAFEPFVMSKQGPWPLRAIAHRRVSHEDSEPEQQYWRRHLALMSKEGERRRQIIYTWREQQNEKQPNTAPATGAMPPRCVRVRHRSGAPNGVRRQLVTRSRTSSAVALSRN